MAILVGCHTKLVRAGVLEAMCIFLALDTTQNDFCLLNSFEVSEHT
ncbi:hypothetical protein ES703_123340 [subsurface metagenome]